MRSIDEPIFVAGIPRSGTSLTAGILAACGAWTGETFGPTPHNQKGSFENKEIRERFIKPYLMMLGNDPLGLRDFPNVDAHIIPPRIWKEEIEKLIASQGYEAGTWLLKDCKLALFHELWDAAFPKAKWIVVRRNRDSIIGSCLRAEPMVRHIGCERTKWERWHDQYLAKLTEIVQNKNVIEIWPDTDIIETTAGIESVINSLGLKYDQATIDAFIEHGFWHELR